MRRIMNRRPDRLGVLLLGALPFLIVAALYVTGSAVRLADNPNDKLLPSLASLGDAVARYAAEPDKRSGALLLWADTAASLVRLVLGLGLATAAGLAVGVLNGLIPYARAGLAPFVAALSMVPPMAVLPILFIVFGLEELSKVMLIAIGVSPYLMRDLALKVEELPAEQLVKAQTLGGSTWQILLRVVLPQVLPRLIDGVRLSLGPAWLFLIAAEAIAASEGLGYRIFLVRRYLAMDVILPYVAWITLLAAAMDLSLRALSRRAFPWTRAGRGA
ncbi:ABC transporter permease [Azospirillum sp. ST 5-10]|uniref:ABC transporter permease n=1 Tax=unclassified Azospirillum TaxID=2630922 RepID=UPI003F49D926